MIYELEMKWNEMTYINALRNINTSQRNGSQQMVLSKQAARKTHKNVGKTKFSLFYKSGKKYNIPSHLPMLKINNHDIERVNTMTFLGVLLDNNLWLKEHKIAKNIELMYSAKLFLDNESLLAQCYSYIHSYLNYANLAWGSAYLTNLKKLRSQQKRAIRIVHNKAKFEHTKELFKSANVLSLHELNILSIGVFMLRAHTKTSPPAFTVSFQRISRLCSTRLSTLNFLKSQLKLTKTKY